MKILLGLSILTLMSCSKNNNDNDNNGNNQQSFEMETGIYEGKYKCIETHTTINKFKIEVTRVSSTIYQIRQIDTADLPTFNMEDKNHSYPFVYLSVPIQTVNSQTLSGSGGVSGDFDADFVVTTKSIYFGITFSDDPVKTISFKGSKL